EAYNVASGTVSSIAELVTALCGSLDAAPEIVYSGSVRPGDAEKWSVDISALRSLGFSPDWDLAAGLAATRDWYRATQG
ncbi:MAG: hypothetical protein WCK06_04980, partial [Actinomycetota bacterium]